MDNPTPYTRNGQAAGFAALIAQHEQITGHPYAASQAAREASYYADEAARDTAADAAALKLAAETDPDWYPDWQQAQDQATAAQKWAAEQRALSDQLAATIADWTPYPQETRS